MRKETREALDKIDKVIDGLTRRAGADVATILRAMRGPDGADVEPNFYLKERYTMPFRAAAFPLSGHHFGLSWGDPLPSEPPTSGPAHWQDATKRALVAFARTDD